MYSYDGFVLSLTSAALGFYFTVRSFFLFLLGGLSWTFLISYS
jgi:hypothetical protein